MQAYDYIIIALLVVAAIWGARRGFAKQLASLLSLVLGYIVAVNFREAVAPMIDAPHPWDSFAAMLGLFVGTSLAIWIAFRFVNGSIEKAGLTSFDVQLGGLFGLAKGFILATALTMFAVVMLGDVQRAAVLRSYSGTRICRLIQHSQRFVPTEWQQTMRPYLETVEEHSNFANQVEQQILDDPFAIGSPSDSGAAVEQAKRYEDPAFGSSQPLPQARLRLPVFDR